MVWAGDRKPDKWTGVVPPIGSTVDVENATYTNTIGAVELKTVWTDPEFDPSLHAFYYARVLEIPTPRWTTIQAKQLGIAPPDVVAATRAGARLELADLVHAERRGAQDREAGHDRGRSEEEGRGGAQRRAAEGVDRAEVDLAAEHGDRRQVHDHLRRTRARPRRAKPLTPLRAGYITQRFPANQAQFQFRYVGRKMALPSLTGDVADASYLGTPGPTTSTTGRSSPRSSARRSRSPSTRWVTSMSARAATSSATPTTRSSPRWRSSTPFR